MKILVVDDEPTILVTTAHVLATMCTTIKTAAGLQEAKDALTSDRFDLVISDLSLSGRHGMEGIELLSHIKRISGETAVFIMTGFGSDDIRQDTYNKGALWYVEKPFAIQELLSKVREVAVSKGLAIA